MLLRTLKKNTTAGHLLIPLLAFVAWLPALIKDSVQQMIFDAHPMPLYRLVLDHIPVDTLMATIASLAIVILIGFYLIRFNYSYNLLRAKTLLPAFIFVMIVSSIPSLHRLHPALLAMVFFIPAFDRLLSSYKTERLSYNIFEASFLLGLGSLMYFNIIFFIFLVWVGLLVLRPVIWREWVFSIMGVIMPWVFYAAGYYFLHDTVAPVLELLTINFIIDGPYRFVFLPEIIFFSFIFLLIILSSRHISDSIPKMKVLPRKIFVLFFWLWLLAIVIYFLIGTADIELIVPAAIPISFLLSHYLQYMRSPLWGNLFLWGIVAGMLLLVWVPW